MAVAEILPAGSTLHGHKIIRLLGRGGFGITYCAQSPKHGTVALKEFFPVGLARRCADGRIVRSLPADMDQADYDFLLKQFTSEAERICSFDHPSIVRGLAYHPNGDGAVLVMRYESGLSLRQHLRQHQKEGFPIAPAPVAQLIDRLLEALDYIHSKKTIHCDIKPSNIFLGRDFNPVLIDFGTARHSFHERCFGEHERLQSFTPYYAPLELSPNGKGNVGPWTDIYQLAAVIYRCLTGGKIPSSEDRLSSKDFDPWMPLAEYFAGHRLWPTDFLQEVDRGLALQPQHRPQSIREWSHRLRPILQRMMASRNRDEQPRPKPPVHAQVIESNRIADDDMRSTWTIVTTKRSDHMPPIIIQQSELPLALKLLIFGLVAALIIAVAFSLLGH